MSTPDQATPMAISDFNLEKVNTSELSSHLSATIQFGGKICIFGQRGTGKTMISKQEIKKSKKREVYMNLSTMERVDIGGYPNMMSRDANKQFIDFILPQIYEPLINGNEKVVLLLDEVDKADQSLWAPLLELVQFYTINGRKLPNLSSIIMTGNLISEGGSRPCLPLLDRAEKYLVEADANSWLDWAGSADARIHPLVFGFIKDNPKDLFGLADPGECYATSSPRGWEMASDILKFGEANKVPSDIINKKIAGCVGKDISIRYNNYYEHYQHILPLINDLYKGEDVHMFGRYDSLEETKKMMTCIVAVNRFSNILHDLTSKNSKELPVETTYLGKFLQKVSLENVIMSVRNQIKVPTLMSFEMDKHPEWKTLFSDVDLALNGPSKDSEK
jgi:hypothetical protein